MNNKVKAEIFEDYEALQEKHEALMPAYNFSFAMIMLSVKRLMDLAPAHGVALETIKVATEEGIKWHVEERAKQKEKM